jgi:hypothetical protein
VNVERRMAVVELEDLLLMSQLSLTMCLPSAMILVLLKTTAQRDKYAAIHLLPLPPANRNFHFPANDSLEIDPDPPSGL